MYFYLPVEVYEEENCVKNHSSKLAALGSRALIVTGRRSSKINGSLADVTEALEREGREYVIFDRVEENPSVETVMEAREEGLRAGADFVVGVGGGSPLDASKAVAFMMCHRDRDASYLYEDDGEGDSLPVAAVPTTCGTGSEVTPASVLTLHEKRTKAGIPHRIFPKLALIDAGYLESAPRDVLRNTAMDALGHLMESWINVKACEFSRMAVSAGLKAWRQSRDVLTGDREAEKRDFRNLMTASTMAGMAIAHTSTSLPHGLSYVLTYETGMPHGKAVGCFLPGFLEAARAEDRSYLLNEAGFTDVTELKKFFQKACGETEVPEDVLRRSVDSLMKNEAKLASCPYPVNRKILEKIAAIAEDDRD